MSTKSQYLLAYRLVRMGVRPYYITHEYRLSPLIVTHAYESVFR